MNERIISMLLSLMMLLLIGCAAAEGTEDASEPVDGGWEIAEDITVTDELKAVFDKGMEELLGVDYEPVAYLASQVVAGTNHCFLCKATVVVPDAVPYYALVYIYEDLDGNTEIMDIVDLNIEPEANG